MNTRFLGMIFVIGTLFIFLNGFRIWGTSSPFPDTLSSLAYLLWGISGVCGIFGLIRLNALGSNAVARAFGFLPIIGFASMVVGECLHLLGLINADDPLYNMLSAIGWIGILVGMLVVGILTIAARTWSGWRRFVPLLTVIMVPIAFGIGQALGSQDLGALLFYSGWLLLGLVIATTEPTRGVQPGLVTG
ncbi:MAG: hypothetical protein A2W35_18360 [Chloroflexi bacterium RBG_16_57_11]|nr:MAG: hypothetical protein A2W35_18360 [Chloroflexi bacterium RBG_16_57_11]